MADDDPNRQMVIIMSENMGSSTIPAACTAVIPNYTVKAMRKHKIRWNIQNDVFYPCPNLDDREVAVQFQEGTLADSKRMDAPLLSVKKGQGNKIQAYIHADENLVPDSKRKYWVTYKDKNASPDPEIDVSGDCPGCGGN